MRIEVDKKDLVRLVKSVKPSRMLFRKLPHVSEYGYSNMKGIWQWKIEELSKLSEVELYELYKNLKRY